jgi:hypothetical protein
MFFLCRDDKRGELTDANYISLGRDALFRRVFKKVGLTDEEREILQRPTPKHFLISKLSPDLELNIIFLVGQVRDKYDVLEEWLFKYYITNEDIAIDVLRYLSTVYYTNNTQPLVRLINAILSKYTNPILLFAIFYDMFYFSDKSFTGNSFLIQYLMYCFKNKDKRTFEFIYQMLQDQDRYRSFQGYLLYSNMDLSTFNSRDETIRFIFSVKRSKEAEVGRIIESLESLDFNKYYKIICDMKRGKVPFIPQNIYAILISMSHEWDGYVQVYFWKIMTFQKMLFGIEPEVGVEVKTVEAVEGLEIIKGVKYSAQEL